MRKIAQFKIQEMSFVLVAIVLFFVISGLFFLAIYYRNLKNKVTNLEEEQAVLIAQRLANYPEFSCGSLCLDADKLIVMQNRKAYRNFWPVETIEVRKIYGSGKLVECKQENYPDCNIFKIFDSGKENIRKVSSFVSLCRKEEVNDLIYHKCEIAKILIGYKIK